MRTARKLTRVPTTSRISEFSARNSTTGFSTRNTVAPFDHEGVAGQRVKWRTGSVVPQRQSVATRRRSSLVTNKGKSKCEYIVPSELNMGLTNAETAAKLAKDLVDSLKTQSTVNSWLARVVPMLGVLPANVSSNPQQQADVAAHLIVEGRHLRKLQQRVMGDLTEQPNPSTDLNSNALPTPVSNAPLASQQLTPVSKFQPEINPAVDDA